VSRLLITTSWDDGHPADMRLADRLAAAGVHATFYICRECEGRPRVSDMQIRELATTPGMEVGSHTLTHPDLRRVSNARLVAEVHGSRDWLEDILGMTVTSFCYPRGLHDRRSVRAVAAAGYRLARTTMGGVTSPSFSPFRMPTTLQVYPHHRSTQLRHALKEGNLSGFWRIAGLSRWARVPADLARTFVTTTDQSQLTILHMWGHSWELEEHDMWSQLEDVLKYAQELAMEPVTNTALLDRIAALW
jgi:peptidoglycan-N-acetylglucosamine deacetylase